MDTQFGELLSAAFALHTSAPLRAFNAGAKATVCFQLLFCQSKHTRKAQFAQLPLYLISWEQFANSKAYLCLSATSL